MLESFPNVHPILVHFPIALLTCAVAVDVVALLTSKRWRGGGLRRGSTMLLLLGTGTLIPTHWAGQRAGDMAASPLPEMQAVLADHADWALWTLWTFVILSVVRVVLTRAGHLHGRGHAAAAVAAMVGLGFLLQTGAHGGDLVYRYGVGVRVVAEAPRGAFDVDLPSAEDSLGPVRGGNGSLYWEFRPGAEEALGEHLGALSGSLPEATVETRETALALVSTTSEERILTLEGVYDDVEVEIEIEFDDFVGSVGLVHHASGPETYDFLELRGGEVVLGRRGSGGETVFARADVGALAGPSLMRVVAAGRHFRGYLDDELMVHGHADAAEAGRVGFIMAGVGSVRVHRVKLTPID